MPKWHILGWRVLLPVHSASTMTSRTGCFPTFQHSIWPCSACQQHPFLMVERQTVELFQASQTGTHQARKGISSHESLCLRGKSFPELSCRSCWPGQAACPHSSLQEAERPILAFQLLRKMEQGGGGSSSAAGRAVKEGVLGLDPWEGLSCWRSSKQAGVGPWESCWLPSWKKLGVG